MENIKSEIDKRLHQILHLTIFPETGSKLAIIQLREEVRVLRNQLKE